MITIYQRIDAFNKLGELFCDISSQKEDSKYNEWTTVFDKKISVGNHLKSAKLHTKFIWEVGGALTS